MKQYEVTIAIPVYNVALYVERSLLSALNQTFQSIEFLIVDDKGQDESMEIVRRVVAEHPRKEDVRIIDQVYNQKLGAARNAGIDNATGKYLFFMDSDDIITSDCIEILYKAMKEHPVDFVAASFVRRDWAGKVYPGGCQYTDTLLEGGEFAVAKYRYKRGGNIFVTVWNKLYPVSFLRRNDIRCIPHHIHEDSWFTYQVILNAKSCRLLPNCTLFYTYNPESLTGTFSANGYSETTAMQYSEIQRMKSKYIARFVNLEFYNGLLVDIMKMSLFHAYQVASSASLSKDVKKKMEQTLLSPPLIIPPGYSLKTLSIKYLLFRMFYLLPLSLKIFLLNCGKNVNLKRLLHRWVHF